MTHENCEIGVLDHFWGKKNQKSHFLVSFDHLSADFRLVWVGGHPKGGWNHFKTKQNASWMMPNSLFISNFYYGVTFSEFWTIFGAKKTKKVIFLPHFLARLALLCSQGRLETTWGGFQVAQAKSFDLRGLEAMSAQRFRRYGRFRQNFICLPKVRFWLFQNDDFNILGEGGRPGWFKSHETTRNWRPLMPTLLFGSNFYFEITFWWYSLMWNLGWDR